MRRHIIGSMSGVDGGRIGGWFNGQLLRTGTRGGLKSNMCQYQHHVLLSIALLEGIENVEAITAVEGMNMLTCGHSDLSTRLGVHPKLEHPRLKAGVRRIAVTCNAQRQIGDVVEWERGRSESLAAHVTMPL